MITSFQNTATMRPMDSRDDVWQLHSRQWRNVGSPNRPCDEDQETLSRIAGAVLSDRRDERVVVLGVTPELVNLPWPETTTLQAFDVNAGMIRQVWSPPKGIQATVQQADWRQLPVADQSVDLVIGDGIFTVTGSQEATRDVLSEVRRILVGDGRVLVRCFVRPDEQETPAQVSHSAFSGKIRNFGSLKWRLAMSLVDQHTSMVRLSDIHTAFQKLFPDRLRLQAACGWSMAEIDTIDAYDGLAAQYSFPTRAQLESQLHDFVAIESCVTGDYELAERCPILLMSARL